MIRLDLPLSHFEDVLKKADQLYEANDRQFARGRPSYLDSAIAPKLAGLQRAIGTFGMLFHALRSTIPPCSNACASL
jgi:hypothetical protein